MSMRRIKVDLAGTTVIYAGGMAPKLKDRATGELKTDGLGQTLHQGKFMVLPDTEDEAGDELWIVVAGEPQGLRRGAPVKVTGLVAIPWEQNGRHGITFRAEAVTPLVTAAPSKTTG